MPDKGELQQPQPGQHWSINPCVASTVLLSAQGAASGPTLKLESAAEGLLEGRLAAARPRSYLLVALLMTT